MSAPPSSPQATLSPENPPRRPAHPPPEDIDEYKPQGFHPVTLGDVLHGRFRVIRKLGWGSWATVWLAQDIKYAPPENHARARYREPDTKRYVALKVHSAAIDTTYEVSVQQHLASNVTGDPDAECALPLSESFVHEGPNGAHSCFVVEPMGPSISYLLALSGESQDTGLTTHRFTAQRCRRILRNILRGLRFLHRHGVVHGDLQLGNVMFPLRNLSRIDPNALRQNDTGSHMEPVARLGGEANPWAPDFLIAPQPLPLNDRQSQDSDLVKLADFGCSFRVDSPPAYIVTPRTRWAPETIVLREADQAIDIWGFGRVMFELLTDGAPLFEIDTDGGRRPEDVITDEYLIQLGEIIGPLPHRFRDNWPRYSRFYGLAGERLADVQPLDDFDDSEFGRAVKLNRAGGLLAKPIPSDSLEVKFMRHKPKDMSDEEAAQVVSLLRETFRIDPRERPSAAELLERPWFRG